MNQFSNNKKRTYDLEERTAQWGEMVIDLVRQGRITSINKSITSQLIRSATSIGANYCEANASSSKRDFRNKIYICKKETNETKHWLRMLVRATPEYQDRARQLWEEAHQLHLIFQKITNTLDKKV